MNLLKTIVHRKTVSNMKELMESRGYSDRTSNAAIDRAREIPRHVALRRVLKRQSEKRPVFALTYDPRLPPIQSIQAKHWRSMVSQDPYLSEVFSQPPLTAYRRQRNTGTIHLQIQSCTLKEDKEE